MAKELSPKKYIETSARKLPVYKCYINKNWASAKLADVYILRKHSNGNITAGVYLVDLSCLGIKDTIFFFNMSESIINERLNLQSLSIEEIDYHLAHNIVFAGHDYALDYDINPHIDFATTRFILEEDSDDIPLIDIPVGGLDGNPHLLLQPGQFIKYKHVYDKLVKNLGKDNFTYSIEIDGPDDFDSANNTAVEEDEEEFISIDDIEPGLITRGMAKDLDIYDLIDVDKVNNRLPHEVISLETELAIRILKYKRKDLFYTEDEIDKMVEYELYLKAKSYPSWINDEIKDGLKEMMDSDIKAFNEYQKINRSEEDLIIFDNNQTIKHLEKYQHNPYVLHILFEKSILKNNKDTVSILRDHISILAHPYLSAKLELALCTYFLEDPDPYISYIIEGTDIQQIFPETEEFSDMELNLFSMLRLLVSIRTNNLKEAIYYYNFLSDIDMITPLMTLLQVQFQDFISDPFMEAFEELKKDELKENPMEQTGKKLY